MDIDAVTALRMMMLIQKTDFVVSEISILEATEIISGDFVYKLFK